MIKNSSIKIQRRQRSFVKQRVKKMTKLPAGFHCRPRLMFNKAEIISQFGQAQVDVQLYTIFMIVLSGAMPGLSMWYL